VSTISSLPPFIQAFGFPHLIAIIVTSMRKMIIFCVIGGLMGFKALTQFIIIKKDKLSNGK
jgi:hypothetical protein